MPEPRQRYFNFFARLLPVLEAARKLDAELDRHLAHRFSALEYLRTDELGLAKIIDDLLNPQYAHGQGPLCLELLLDELRETLGLELPGGDPELSQARVVLELRTRNDRRIDICVKVHAGARAFHLAIENEPYAHDQKKQIRDYLEHLHATSGDSFLLLYLSPNRDGPADLSLPRHELPTLARRRKRADVTVRAAGRWSASALGHHGLHPRAGRRHQWRRRSRGPVRGDAQQLVACGLACHLCPEIQARASALVPSSNRSVRPATIRRQHNGDRQRATCTQRAPAGEPPINSPPPRWCTELGQRSKTSW